MRRLPSENVTVDGSVLAPFDHLVAATPDALAVIDADGTDLTYRQLRQAADRFADRLPIEPGEMVGLSMPRGAALVAAMVGIVRAGGVYVPFTGFRWMQPESTSGVEAGDGRDSSHRAAADWSASTPVQRHSASQGRTCSSSATSS